MAATSSTQAPRKYLDRIVALSANLFPTVGAVNLPCSNRSSNVFERRDSKLILLLLQVELPWTSMDQRHGHMQVCVLVLSARRRSQTPTGWTPDHHKRALKELKKAAHGKFVRRRMKETDVLVIDEISMVENLHFERLNAVMKEAREDGSAFGGVQVIVTGDVSLSYDWLSKTKQCSSVSYLLSSHSVIASNAEESLLS